MYECYLCDKTFKAYIHIKTHMAQHSENFKKFCCAICSKMYTTKYNLDAHRAAHMGKRTFTCDQCPNTYLRQNALNVHKKSAHLKIRYQCKFCDKWFGQDKSLVEHLFSHRGYKPVSSIPFGFETKNVIASILLYSGTVLSVDKAISGKISK
jgi:uncharacterized Zn-finger protein